MKLEIHNDQTPVNPYRDWDQLGTIVSWHPGYTIGEQPGVSKKAFKKDIVGDAVCLDIYMYGRSHELTTHPLSHGAVGHIGYIYVTEEALENEGLSGRKVEDIEKMLAAELETYNHYHMGNVWGFVVKNECECCGKPTDHHDSCWGFYGEFKDDVKEHMLDHIPEEVHDQFDDAWERRFESL